MVAHLLSAFDKNIIYGRILIKRKEKMNTITLLILCPKKFCPRNKETKECIHEYEKGI